MKLVCSEFFRWSDETFQAMIDFKSSMQSHLATFFPETLTDYRKLLHPESPFMSDYEWHGFLVHSNGALVGKAILAWKKGSLIGNLGFIDWINDESAAHLLITQVEAFARSKGLRKIKTPIDLNFFVKYRIKCPGGGDPYYGEPIYPDYYHDLFKATGLEIVGTWDTSVIKRFKTFTYFFKKRKAKPYNDELELRFIKISDWDSELIIVHQLFVASYKDMAEFEPISFEQFKILYDDFKYIIHPYLSYIAEYKGEAVAFSINYPDPLAILGSVKHKKLSPVQRMLLLIRLRLNFKTLLMPYIGKTTMRNGEDLKGVLVKLSKCFTYGILVANKTLVCYQSPDSPSKRPFDPKLLKPYAKYVLYGKDL